MESHISKEDIKKLGEKKEAIKKGKAKFENKEKSLIGGKDILK